MLSIENLILGYNEQVVLQLPQLVVSEGTHCLLLGKSGAGKTTLIYAIAGLLKPLSGSILINDNEITKLSHSALDNFRGKNISLVFQTLRMIPAFTILQNLLLAQSMAGLKEDEIFAESLLAKLGVLEKSNDKPQSLSQGQLQRVAIARALVNKPKLILCDEPTSSLDDENCEIVINLLLDSAKYSGASLIIATHDARITKHFSNVLSIGEVQ